MKLNILLTHLIALLGAILFLALGIPLPWLFGPMFACLIAAFAGFPLKGIKPLNATMRTILGVAVGTTVTLSFLGALLGLWQTLIFVPIMVLFIGLLGVPYFQRLCGYDFATSYYASMPGGLQDMLVFGQEAGGNLRALSLIHATRVLVIVTTLPLLLSFYWSAELTNPPGLPANALGLGEMLLMAACGIVGWRIAKAVGMFGASILGPMILTAIFALSGFIENRPPAEAIWAAQFFIGITIGVNYVGITVAELRKDVLAGFGYSIIFMTLTFALVWFIGAYEIAPAQDALLAFTPGGQAELVVLALIVGADLRFVVAHHLLRLVIVIIGAPVIAALISKEPRD